MIDRLIAAAGAVADVADRAVRTIVRGAGSSVADTRPGSVALAAVLLVLAGAFVLVGLESDGGPMRTIGAAEVPADASLGQRVHATVDGQLASTYVETFLDLDGDGVQSDGEDGQAWAYWMVDATTRTGVTVLSLGPPWEIFEGTYTGVVTTDPAYVRDTIDYVEDELGWAGVVLDPDVVIDATVTGGAPGVEHSIADDWPDDGTTVTVSGPRSATYVEWCSEDADDDGQCDDEEIDTYDVIMLDVEAGTAVLVVTEDDPEFQPVTLTGMLRHDASAVAEAVNAPGFTLDDYDITVSPSYVLDVGATPPDPGVSMLVAVVLAGLGLTILVGVAGGYVGYRKTGVRPAGATTMAVDDVIAVRLTGVIRSPVGLTHVRDVPAALRRFVTRVAPPVAPDGVEAPDGTSDPDRPLEVAPLDSTLIVERIGRPEGVALGVGELQRVSVGSATTFRGARPALRATAGTGPLILSFADAATRDRAAAELVAEAGLDMAGPAASPTSVEGA